METQKEKHANGKTKLSLDTINMHSQQDTLTLIDKKAGKRPKLPVQLEKGIWSEQSLKVLEERYLRRDEEGNVIETPDELCWRVAWDIASANVRWGGVRKDVIKSAKEYYHLLVTHEFLPNSPTLMNAGTGNGMQYSGCYVLPVGDSLIEIFDAIKYQAVVHQTGGGTGFSFSRLRPRGSVVKSSRGTASGPVSFMRVFDAATNEIKQGGKRRGANMGILRVDHPDILEFIHCKEEGGITNFNISVGVTDAFMKAYENDGEYELVDPKTHSATGKLSARFVFDQIADGAWRTGDPGLVFIDRLNSGSSNPVPSLGPVESTNPCGEQPLYPYDSCNLGSIFLTYFTKKIQDKYEVDWQKLKKATRLAVKFLDGVIEMNPYPLDEVRKTTLGIRRIGLGVGGWADMLIDLSIPYDSEEALKLGAKIMKTIQDEAELETKELARERGPFPLWPVSNYKNGAPRRNSTVTTIAPTGSISIIAGASSGIEPLFAVAFRHVVKDKHLDRTLTFVNPKLQSIGEKRGFLNEDIKEKVLEYGVVREITEIPEDVRRIFGTAHEIHHDWHIKTQSAFQKHTENAVSKTINMRHDTTREEIKEAYLLAWKTNCKGITVFRDGCKDAQVLNLGIKDKKEEVTVEKKVWERPMMIAGNTYKIKTPVGTAFITVNQDDAGSPVEVFINIGKAGSDVQAMAEALGRIISKSLKFAGNLTARERAFVIIDQLRGIGGRTSVGFGQNKIRSLPDAVAVALSSELKITSENISNHAGNGLELNTETGGQMENTNGHANGNSSNGHIQISLTSTEPFEKTEQIQTENMTRAQISSGDICPSCGAMALVYEEGCSKCVACGHSEC
jgi:ribonucleoside-diphosphate reductase alpha chain